ncbi:MAG TPA: hypothetical protein VK737_11340 [Opitutales bacterium]|jgi:hypothetical protein|nr:hypothetical protein [Opitutales bacterium]
MFISKRQSDNVFSHWIAPLDNFQFSTQEFYDEVEKELAARQVPGLKISRVDFFEGSVLSDKRTYLRLARERYAFDVCAAPFGREYFFSVRLVEKPRLGLLALLAICVLLAFLSWLIGHIGINALGLAVLAALAYFGYWIFRTTPTEGEIKESNSPGKRPVMPDLQSLLLDNTVIGAWYDRFRKDTYFRHDTRLMYLTVIAEIVKMKVDEVTAAKGVKLIRSYEYSPILGELYKTATVKPNAEHATV